MLRAVAVESRADLDRFIRPIKTRDPLPTDRDSVIANSIHWLYVQLLLSFLELKPTRRGGGDDPTGRRCCFASMWKYYYTRTAVSTGKSSVAIKIFL